MADAPMTMSLGNGATFDSTGKALNTQAVTDVNNLNPNAVNNTYNSFIAAPATSPAVTSSNSAQTAVDNTKNSITGLPQTVIAPPATTPTNTYQWGDGTTGHSTPDIYGFGTAGYNASTDPRNAVDNTAIEQQRSGLQQRRDAEIAGLKLQQAEDTTALTTTQDNETGSSNRNLLAMGGYLGNNSFTGSYLASLQVSHEQSMQALQSKYQSAISAANNAYSDNDFKLAQQEVQNAKDIQKEAQARNTEFLNQTDKIQTQQMTQARDAFNEANATATQEATRNRDAATFAKDNGISKAYYAMPGSSIVYDSKTGLPVTKDEYLANGGSPDMSSIQTITNQYQSAEGKEYQDYVMNQQANHQPALTFNQYATMDANRKATHVTNTTISYNQAADQKLTDAISRYGQKLQTLAGKTDGKVSPQDWSKGYASWIAEGLPGNDYQSNFQGFVNYNDPGAAKNYSLK